MNTDGSARIASAHRRSPPWSHSMTRAPTTRPALSAAELDAVDTHLCKTMTRLGEALAPLFLAIERLGDAAAAQRLADAAAEDLAASAPG
jgi:hypothetical protein